MYNLGFISDENIFCHVKETINEYRNSITLTEFNKNIVDPIKLTFDSKIYGKTFKETIESECIRQIDKSNTNKIGDFHQNIFKYLGEGWEVPKSGYDIVNIEKNIFVELKNKHNTMNSSSAQKTYDTMQKTILLNDKATCYLVEVIAKKSQDISWNITKDGERFSHERIRRMSIDKFYELVTGVPNAFKLLCEKLPKVIEDVIKESDGGKIENSVLDELAETSDDIFKSLFSFSFKTYKGFDSF